MSIWVLREERVPLLDDRIYAGRAKNGDWNNDADCYVTVEAGNEDCVDSKEADDGIARSIHLADGGENADDDKYDCREAEEWCEEDAIVNEAEAKEWREGVGDIADQSADTEFWHE